LVIAGEMKRTQILEGLGLKHRETFGINYLQPAIAAGFIELTIPEKTNSPKQSYRLIAKGLQLQKKLRNSKK
jgi:ATP-dependent DNA helicase RecG